MGTFGHFALCAAWFICVGSLIGGALAGRSGSRVRTEMAARGTMLVALFCTAALAALGYAFLTDDYTNHYVWAHSNRDMADIYKIAAIWGGMDGSMLLWAGMLAFSAGIVAFNWRSYPARLTPWVLCALNGSTLFFLSVVVFLTNPFRHLRATVVPPDGNGLNPLLQNPLMAVHPPTLYAGFTTFAVPFAFCIAALLANSLNNEWIKLTRQWTLVAWGFLTAGIVIGGHWAYVELGWGGFWAWDPVENSSFLPWLTGTAFLHSVMVQERKNMLKTWNVWLIVLTYGLTVFGTFLTRSGVVQSVHAFAETDIGWVFLVYLAAVFGGVLVLTIVRRDELRSERKLESFLSRETAFLVNNLIFLAICFSTLWGVMFPVLSEAVTGTKQAVGIPFFNAVNVPLFLVLILLMGVGPLVAWKRASLESLRKTFLVPFVLSFVCAVILVWAGVEGFYPVLSYALCVFVLLTVMGEFHRGYRSQRSASADAGAIEGATRLFRRHHQRYGAYIVHLGVAIAVVGITASMAHKVEREFSLSTGETYEVGRFTVRLDAIEPVHQRNYDGIRARATVLARNDGSELAVLHPELRRYPRNNETTTEVALRVTLREDVYLILAGLDETGERAALKIFINPLQVWLWFGSLVMLAGTIIVLIPRGVVVRSEALESARESNAVRSS